MSRSRRRKKVSTTSPRLRRASVWEAMNQPVVEVTDEAARAIFLFAAVILLMVWLTPHFGNVNQASARGMETEAVAMEYQPLFGEYPSVAAEEEVAGASTEALDMAAPAWYIGLAVTGNSLGDFYQETLAVPFATAATEIFDISEPVQEIVGFYEPGVQAVWDAWIELMADPM